MSAHIGDDLLVTWLETGRPSSVGQHLEECGDCLDRLDALTDLGTGVRAELATVTAPPQDLADRTTGRVKDRLAVQEAVSVVFELFTLPWRIVDALVDDSDLRPRVVPSDAQGGDDANREGVRRDG